MHTAGICCMRASESETPGASFSDRRLTSRWIAVCGHSCSECSFLRQRKQSAARLELAPASALDWAVSTCLGKSRTTPYNP